MLDKRGEGLAPEFADSLRRVLAHYGVRTLDRTPELEESLLWIYKSHQRVDQQIAPVLRLLERRLERVVTGAPQAGEAFRGLLDRIVSVTRGLSSAISDLAREVRYRYFDQPLFEEARNRVYAQAEDHLACLAADPNAPDRQLRVRELVECPQPLVSMFSARFSNAERRSAS